MINVLSLRNGWLGDGEVYVGRAVKRSSAGGALAGSALANPFPVYTHTAEAHAKVVAQYKAWLWAGIKRRDGEICAELMRLKALAMTGNLGLKCWCAPLPCHADVVKACIEWLIKESIEL